MFILETFTQFASLNTEDFAHNKMPWGGKKIFKSYHHDLLNHSFKYSDWFWNRVSSHAQRDSPPIISSEMSNMYALQGLKK